MRAKLGLKNPMILLALLGLMVFAGSCRNNEVEVPPLTGPSGHRLFINVQANPDHLVIHAPGRPRETSEITLQLKNQQGAGVPGEGIKLRILNGSGFEVNIGRLSDYNVTTDGNGFARVIYTAPDSAEQVVATTVIIRAVLTNAAYPDEVVDNHPLELQASSVDPGDCAGGLVPEEAFTINPTTPNVGDTVCFDATGTFPTAIEFFWSFGDGGSATGPVVCHQFDDFGTFTVSVLGRDGDRNCGQQTQAIVVAQGAAPTCTILVSPTPVLVDQLTNFTGVATDPDNDRIRRYQWIFGDGGTASSSRNTVTHRYDDPGSFAVVLTVTDDTGLTGTCQTTVAVTTELPTTACADGIDNDGDTLVDLDDPGCTDPTDLSELGIAQCDDGVDNDGDGFADFPDDPQCVSPADNDEAL